MFLQTSDLAGPEFEPTLQTSTVELKRSACVFCFVAGCANTVRTSSISYTYDDGFMLAAAASYACVSQCVCGSVIHTCSTTQHRSTCLCKGGAEKCLLELKMDFEMFYFFFLLAFKY